MKKNRLGMKTLILLTLNAILGTGIFFLPAIGASYAGTASLFSWIIISVASILFSMYFAELVSMFPRSGGAYEYMKESFGEVPSFLIGWTSWIICNITIAMLMLGSFMYLMPQAGPVVYILLTIVFVVIFSYINFRGINYSAKLLIFFGIVTISTIVAIILPGFSTTSIKLEYSVPLSAIFLATYYISENFFGLETTAYLVEEAHNPRKSVPKAMVWSTIIIAALTILLVIAVLGFPELNTLISQNSPLSYMIERTMGSTLGSIFSILIFIPLIGTAAGWIISSPRLLYAMARDKVLPHCFQKIHKKHKTPYNAIALQAVVIVIVSIVSLGSFKTVLGLLIPLVIIMYSAMLVCFIKLRKTHPGKRHYKAPFGKYGAASLIVFYVGLLLLWLVQPGSLEISIMGVIFILIGIPLYMIIKLSTDTHFVEGFYDRISWLWDRSFRIWYDSKEAKNVINKIEFKKGMTILDFGCGSGITTLELAKKIRQEGTIVAVDISEKQLENAYRKINHSMKISNVVFIKESHLDLKIKFDALTMVGVVEHMNNPKKDIRKIFSTLKKGATFSIMSFGSTMGIPAPEFLADKKELKNFFKSIGVDVEIKSEKKKLTEYVYMWGKKK